MMQSVQTRGDPKWLSKTDEKTSVNKLENMLNLPILEDQTIISTALFFFTLKVNEKKSLQEI